MKKPQLEELAFQIWVARCQHHDLTEETEILDMMRPYAMKLIKVKAVQWTAEHERFLVAACLNYSSSLQRPFDVYFRLRYERCFSPAWIGRRGKIQIS